MPSSISDADFFWRLINTARRLGSAPLDSERRTCLCERLGFELPVAIYQCSGLLALGARAFAFDNGVYVDCMQPLSPSLLLHEIAHLLQQRSGRVKNIDSREVAFNFDTELETEADGISCALQTDGILPPWVYDQATIRDDAVVQFLRLIDLNSNQTARWNAFVKATKAANANQNEVAAALENVNDFSLLEPLMNEFVSPGLGFDGAAAVHKFVSEHPKKVATSVASSHPGSPNITSPKQSGPGSSGGNSGFPSLTSPKQSGPGNSGGNSSTNTNTNSTAPWGQQTKVVPSSHSPEPKDPVKLVVSSASDEPGMLGAQHAAQNWDDVVAILKQTTKPSNVTAVKANKMFSTSGETREAEVMLKFSDGSDYKFVLHYHPPQAGSNWLHFKNNQHASENHKVKWDHWAIKAAGIKESKFTAGKLL